MADRNLRLLLPGDERSTRCDFHLHTDRSDGIMAPRTLAESCRRAGLRWWAVTDHDSVAAWRELAGTPGLVPGVEATAGLDGREVHIVGLGIDPDHPVLAALLADIRQRREARLAAILARLPAKLRDGIGLEDLRDGRAETLTRSHLAKTLLRKCRVKSIYEAFSQWLGDEHLVDPQLPGFPAIAVVAGAIRAAGGVALLAHPGIYRQDAFITTALDCGLDGLEIDHPELPPERRSRLDLFAAERGLLRSSGSDLHAPGTRRPGDWSLPASAWQPLWERLGLPDGNRPAKPALPAPGAGLLTGILQPR